MDPLDTETSRFWENFGPQNPSDPASDPDRSLPAADDLLRRGERLAGQFGALAAMALEGGRSAGRRAEPTSGSCRASSTGMREMYRKEGGAFPDPILNLTWDYTDPVDPGPGGTGQGDERPRAGRPQGPERRGDAARRPAARRLRAVARRRHHRLAAAGSSRAATPRRATRWRGATRPTRASRASRRTGPGRGRPTGGSSTIAPAPIPAGQAVEPARSRSSNGTAAAGSASTCPDYGPTAKPSDAVGPFIMNAEGVGRLFARDQMAEGPFPEHYEPFESPSRERAASEGPRQPGGARLRRRPRGVRHRDGLPLCRDDLPADRAFPLLDQARADQCDPAAARSSSRSAKRWPRRRASSKAAGCGSPPSAAWSSARPM